jgi:hypothetical protein
MYALFLKAAGIWLLLVATAVLNGLFREKIPVSFLGSGAALPARGLLITVLTLSFEIVLAAVGPGKFWEETMSVLGVNRGNLFIPVLLSTAFAPVLATRARRYTR